MYYSNNKYLWLHIYCFIEFFDITKLFSTTLSISLYDFLSYILKMRATLNNLGKKKQENTWGKNVDNSLLIVQKERGSVKKLIKLALKVGKHPLKFNESFSAKNIRTLNRS